MTVRILPIDSLQDNEKQLYEKMKEFLDKGLEEQLQVIVEESSYQARTIVNRFNRENLTVLHDATRKRQLGCVKVLVEVSQADVNAKSLTGITPLHLAAKYGEKVKKSEDDDELGEPDDYPGDPLIAYLVSRGARVNERDQNGLTPLHFAANRGRLQSVIQLIRDGADIECLDDKELTPLLLAVKYDNRKVITMLLKCGANYKCVDKRNCNILHYASLLKSDIPIKLIHKQLGEITGPEEFLSLMNQTNKKRETPLHWAIMDQSDQISEFLLDEGADIHVRTIKEQTALHLAAYERSEVVTNLIDRGADVEAVDIDYQTPLFKAIQHGNRLEVETLLERGANVHHLDVNSQTPLLAAAKLGNGKICQILLESGADIMARDNQQRTALFLAVSGKHHAVVELLIQDKQAEAFVDLADSLKNTPLHAAVYTGYLETTMCLLNNYADYWLKNVLEHTPLHVAAIQGCHEIAHQLLYRNPCVAHERDEDGNYATHLAAEHGFPLVISEILKGVRQINEKNVSGWTPLMYAAAHNHADCVELLLNQGAKVNSRDRLKITSLFLACQHGYTDVVNLLLKHRADVTIRVGQTHESFPGWTALDIAVENQHLECVRSIIQSDSWEPALCNVTTDQPKYWDTPLRRMIREMPEAADLVLSRCVVVGGDLSERSPYHSITFDFRYLKDEEILNDFEAGMNKSSQKLPQPIDFTTKDEKLQNGVQWQYGQQTEPMLDREQWQPASKLITRAWRKFRGSKAIPPVEMMIQSGREELLHHPLVTAMLTYKWVRLGFLYYVNLFAYTLFLALFTSFMLLTEAPYLLKNGTIQSSFEVCMELEKTGVKAYQHHIGFSKYATLLLSIFGLILELFQFSQFRLRYFNLGNCLEFSIFLLGILTTVDTNQCMMETGLREDWQWGCGTVGIFLAWINLLLFIRQGPVFGIYVIMFVSITMTFAKVFIVFSPFLIAFALAFHALLVNENAFKNMHNSILKTFAMTIGELDLGDHVFERFSNTEPEKQVHYEALTYVMFVVFLTLMCIVMMNLLVGLAVDDIKAVQRKATLKRQEMKIDLLLSAETVLSRFGRLVSMPKQYEYRPNSPRTWMDTQFHKAYTLATETVKEVGAAVDEESTALESVEKRLDAVQLLLNKLMERINAAGDAMPTGPNQQNAATVDTAMVGDTCLPGATSPDPEPATEPIQV